MLKYIHSSLEFVGSLLVRVIIRLENSQWLPPQSPISNRWSLDDAQEIKTEVLPMIRQPDEKILKKNYRIQWMRADKMSKTGRQKIHKNKEVYFGVSENKKN